MKLKKDEILCVHTTRVDADGQPLKTVFKKTAFKAIENATPKGAVSKWEKAKK